MNIALIIGCARSGTSILGELIVAHPGVKYIFEAHHIWELAGLGADDSHRLVAQHATPNVKKRILKWFEEQKGSVHLLLEKTPRNILRVPFVREIFPKAKIIHIIRDGRDVACSMVPGCGEKQWSHLKPPSWKTLFSHYDGPVRCALAWKEIMEIALEDLTVVPHLQVRYEDLIGQPQNVACRILSYLELPQHPKVTGFCSKIQDSTSGSYHAQHQAVWYRENHRTRMGRWQENLTQEEQRIINDLLSSLLTKLGYQGAGK